MTDPPVIKSWAATVPTGEDHHGRARTALLAEGCRPLAEFFIGVNGTERVVCLGSVSLAVCARPDLRDLILDRVRAELDKAIAANTPPETQP